MPMNTADRTEAGRHLGRRMRLGEARIADINLDDLRDAVGSIDDTMDLLPAALDQTKTMKANLVANLPAVFRATTNPTEKALALVVWALKETGEI